MKIQMQEIITDNVMADAIVEVQLDHERNEFYIDGLEFNLVTDIDGIDLDWRSLPAAWFDALMKKVDAIFDSSRFMDYVTDEWERAYGY